MSTAYRTTCEDCGWTATLPTEEEATSAGAAHTCPPPRPAGRKPRPTVTRPCTVCGIETRSAKALCAEHRPTKTCGPSKPATPTSGRWPLHWGESAHLTPEERADALCTQVGDPELFFPNPSDRDGNNAAKRVCAGCPIRHRCLDVALANREEYGVFGGLTERERAALLRDQNRSVAA